MQAPRPELDSLSTLTELVTAFRDERDWAQFHTVRNLSAGLCIESAELQELFLWKRDDEVTASLEDGAFRERVEEELADVGIFLLYLARAAGVNLGEAIATKLEKNARKYPVHLSRGNSKKYTELQTEP